MPCRLIKITHFILIIVQSHIQENKAKHDQTLPPLSLPSPPPTLLEIQLRAVRHPLPPVRVRSAPRRPGAHRRRRCHQGGPRRFSRDLPQALREDRVPKGLSNIFPQYTIQHYYENVGSLFLSPVILGHARSSRRTVSCRRGSLRSPPSSRASSAC